MTRTQRIRNVHFKKGTARQALYTPNSQGDFYTPQKENTMGRLDRGHVSMQKSIDREPSKGIGMKQKYESSYDY